jgi:hypothetical protein
VFEFHSWLSSCCLYTWLKAMLSETAVPFADASEKEPFCEMSGQVPSNVTISVLFSGAAVERASTWNTDELNVTDGAAAAARPIVAVRAKVRTMVSDCGAAAVRSEGGARERGQAGRRAVRGEGRRARPNLYRRRNILQLYE